MGRAGDDKAASRRGLAEVSLDAGAEWMGRLFLIDSEDAESRDTLVQWVVLLLTRVAKEGRSLGVRLLSRVVHSDGMKVARQCLVKL